MRTRQLTGITAVDVVPLDVGLPQKVQALPHGACASVCYCHLMVPSHMVSGWDIDELFAYETVKIVRVRDYKLGMINYA
jgi:hypothetical protein